MAQNKMSKREYCVFQTPKVLQAREDYGCCAVASSFVRCLDFIV